MSSFVKVSIVPSPKPLKIIFNHVMGLLPNSLLNKKQKSWSDLRRPRDQLLCFLFNLEPFSLSMRYWLSCHTIFGVSFSWESQRLTESWAMGSGEILIPFTNLRRPARSAVDNLGFGGDEMFVADHGAAVVYHFVPSNRDGEKTLAEKAAELAKTVEGAPYLGDGETWGRKGWAGWAEVDEDNDSEAGEIFWRGVGL
jgi:hypothetical protein